MSKSDVDAIANRLKASMDQMQGIIATPLEEGQLALLPASRELLAGLADLLGGLSEAGKIGSTPYHVEIPGWGSVRVHHAADPEHAAELAVAYMDRCTTGDRFWSGEAFSQDLCPIPRVEVFDGQGESLLLVASVFRRTAEEPVEYTAWPEASDD